MNNYRFETLQLHVGQETPDPATDARAVPIYATASYVFQDCAHAAARFSLEEGGNIYSRLTNSTQDVLEKRIAALEGGVAALALSSGAAAIAYTIEALALNGGHIVAQKTIYGGSYNLLAHTLPNFGITASFVDIHDLDEVERAIEPNTRAIYIETLGNPNSDIPDIDALAELAHRHGLPLVVDNTFGTPYLIRPIEHGADLVVHSATKFLGGHGTTLGCRNIRLGGLRQVSCHCRPKSQLSRSFLCPGSWQGGVRHLCPGGSAAGYWRLHFSLCRLPAAAGRGDPFSAHRAPCGEYQEGGGIFG